MIFDIAAGGIAHIGFISDSVFWWGSKYGWQPVPNERGNRRKGEVPQVFGEFDTLNFWDYSSLTSTFGKHLIKLAQKSFLRSTIRSLGVVRPIDTHGDSVLDQS